MSKKYGLIIPGKDKPAPPKADFSKPSVFGSDDSESDNENGKPNMLPKMRAAPIGPGAAERRQARILQQKALEEDPTVFQYDELYDQIETKRDEDKKTKSNEVKKPKYINRLLQQAERRKLENERRIERTVQKERDDEGEQFKDKESYVTSAYRKKLDEMKKAEEQEKREDYLESIGDVRKQQDLGGFYRHLYEQKLGTKEETLKQQTENVDDAKMKKKLKTSRSYRKRHSSDDEKADKEEQEVEEKSANKKAHIQSNLDADSDFSIDSSSDSDGDDIKESETKEKRETNNSDKIHEKSELEKTDTNKPSTSNNNEVKIEKGKDEPVVEEVKPKKPKIDIWKKRTVGDVFDAALQRYYERKSARNG